MTLPKRHRNHINDNVRLQSSPHDFDNRVTGDMNELERMELNLTVGSDLQAHEFNCGVASSDSKYNSEMEIE